MIQDNKAGDIFKWGWDCIVFGAVPSKMSLKTKLYIGGKQSEERLIILLCHETKHLVIDKTMETKVI